MLVGGGLGCAAGGLLSDALLPYTPAAKAYVIAVSQVLAAPAIFGVLWAGTSTASLGVLVLAYVTAETWLGPAAAVVQDIVPPHMRARASAVYITVNTLVGGCGPLIVGSLLGDSGLVTQRWGYHDGVRYALVLLVPPCYMLSAVLFWLTGLAIKPVPRLADNVESAALLGGQTDVPCDTPTATVTTREPSGQYLEATSL